MNLLCIPPNQVERVWPGVRTYIYRAIAKADLIGFAPVEAAILDGSALLWVAYDGERVWGAAATQIIQTEHRRVLHIMAASGNLKTGQQLIGEIEKYGRDAGCVASRITGRLGWAKALPDYKHKRAILEKVLSHG